MTTAPRRETAKIYQFPVRGRTDQGGRRPETTSTERSAYRFADAAFGSGWYHDAAIQDAERSRKP
ncbi:DUF2735 domain-containing protein [Methylobacterium nodulans]|uniref:DUF2735 domain-containing protein n=1 Tax=Methylobacterium nodulans (strain LMG 21967 / CNCM I-2342 / ORS 2060) TaxID=460265 RepID=B8ICY1_METNO|nr:DUF2735 domain-containing protein [Methylobacterium nodulans]ACL59373.1 conserved hypothetical protein [Methylobacterium nodulans ORS 2060]